MKRFSICMLLFLSITASTGCNDASSSDELDFDPIDIEYQTHSLALTKANSCDDYRAHVLDSLARRIADVRFSGSSYYWGEIADDAVNSPSSNETGGSSNGSSAGEFTTTNVQEKGVDEPDTVKNDGQYMYAIKGDHVVITKVWPAEEMAVVSTLPRALDGKEQTNGKRESWVSPSGLMLSGTHLFELGTVHSYTYDDNRWYGNYESVVSIRVFDVSDPINPQLVKTHQIEGHFQDARFVNNRLHVISSAEPSFDWYDVYELAESSIPTVPRYDHKDCWDKLDWDDDNWDEEWDKCIAYEKDWEKQYESNVNKYLPVIRGWLEAKYPTISNIKLPQYSDGSISREAFGCEEMYIPGTSSTDDGFLVVSEISGDSFENFTAQAVADYGWTVYASTENLYVVSNSYNWSWFDGDSNGYSHIHHFNLGDSAGHVKYVNSGELDGFVTDQFWLSEYDNHLRVVTNSGLWGNSVKGHTLSVLDINSPKVMNVTGSVSGFGKNESIYAARMFGKKGYVVTFRNTDPLYAFDLSDPNKPMIAGELKITGYSSYIHPVGENHLLTIGKSGDESGNITGMHLQLFDVSDLSNPTLKYNVKVSQDTYISDDDRYYSSYGWSEALSNHHAFNYHEGSGLLAIPVNISSYSYTFADYDWSSKYFSGMFIYRVTPDSDFEFLGGIDHSNIDKNSNEAYRYWWSSVDRARFYFAQNGVYDENAYVYTISDIGIKVNNANNPSEEIKSVNFDN